MCSYGYLFNSQKSHSGERRSESVSQIHVSGFSYVMLPVWCICACEGAVKRDLPFESCPEKANKTYFLLSVSLEVWHIFLSSLADFFSSFSIFVGQHVMARPAFCRLCIHVFHLLTFYVHARCCSSL